MLFQVFYEYGWYVELLKQNECKMRLHWIYFNLLYIGVLMVIDISSRAAILNTNLLN